MSPASAGRPSLLQLVALALALAASTREARAEPPAASQPEIDASHAGWRTYAVTGAPSILGIGIGYKLGRAELLGNAGGFLYFHTEIAVAQVNLNVDLIRWPHGSAYVGGSYALRRELVEVECDADEAGCDSGATTHERTATAGPRLGARTVLLPDAGLGGPLQIDVSAGPRVDSCGSGCVGEPELGFAAEIRVVLSL